MRSIPGTNRLDIEMDYRKRINQAMLYIREHTDARLPIIDIARKANFSPFHFHRIFTAFVGETVGDYITRMRMAKAALLIDNGLSVTRAASRSGYKTASSFIQVFKKSFGILPSKVRTSGKIVYIKKKPANNHFRTGSLIADLRELPALKMVSIQSRVKANEDFTTIAGIAFDKLHRYLDRQNLTAKISMRLGVLRDFDIVNTKNCRFDACVVIPDSADPPVKRPVKADRIEEGKWAVFLHRGPYDTLWQTWNRIYRSWHPPGSMKLRNAYPFEVYLNNKRTTEPSNLLTEIYIPVED
jgi:AraC family transcriptional regulator